jgi:hypothetical protein
MKLSPLFLLAVAGAVHAAAPWVEEAYIQPVDGAKVGDVVRLDSPTVLFVNKRCDLQVGNAALMRFYASYQGKWITGCWAKNVHGEAVILVPRQATTKVPLSQLARAAVSSDGSARITALPPSQPSHPSTASPPAARAAPADSAHKDVAGARATSETGHPPAAMSDNAPSRPAR